MSALRRARGPCGRVQLRRAAAPPLSPSLRGASLCQTQQPAPSPDCSVLLLRQVIRVEENVDAVLGDLMVLPVLVGVLVIPPADVAEVREDCFVLGVVAAPRDPGGRVWGFLLFLIISCYFFIGFLLFLVDF